MAILEVEEARQRTTLLFEKYKNMLSENMAEVNLESYLVEVIQKCIQHSLVTGKNPDSNSELGRETSIRLCQIFDHAETQQFAYDLVLKIAAELLDKGYSVPILLSRWLAGHLRGQHKRQHKRGKSRHQNAGRDMLIGFAVAALERDGITPTRNDEKKTPKSSGCDIVADVLNTKFGMPMDYTNAKRIWIVFKKDLKRHA